jgi:polysaccharide export outer membrane protein
MRFAVFLTSVLAVGACAAFPHDGPSGPAVQEAAAKAAPKFALLDLNYRVDELIAAQPPAPFVGLAPASSDAPVDLIAPGDVLAVSVFEAGTGGLFARPAEVAGGATPESFPHIVVDSRGMLSIPFAGDVRVAGLTPRAASEAIGAALHGRAVDPQVAVTRVESPGGSVTVMGEVRNSGRIMLATNNDRLLDVIAAAGGITKSPGNVEVVVARGTMTAHESFADLLRNPADNIRLAPRDQVRLLYAPHKYSTFGALTHNAQMPIEDGDITLAGAISRAGGLNPDAADGSYVLVFRFERPAVAAALGVAQPPSPRGVPIIYRLDLRAPQGYFVANNFEVRPDDLIYVPQARISQARQFIDLVTQASAIAYNVRVTSVLP